MPLAKRPAQQRIGVAAGCCAVPDAIDGCNPMIEDLFAGDLPR